MEVAPRTLVPAFAVWVILTSSVVDICGSLDQPFPLLHRITVPLRTRITFGIDAQRVPRLWIQTRRDSKTPWLFHYRGQRHGVLGTFTEGFK